MTNDQIKAFYREIGDVCRKYKMSALAGVWFSGEGNDEFGQLQFWDVSDTRMRLIVEDLSEKYEYWAKHTLGYIKRPLGSIHEILKDDDDKN